ncbi:MAG TPA: inositol monophosphatase family protein [Azospirillum sp.]|nr:inositol monophosphatase family protein [Azospirillum sp.]
MIRSAVPDLDRVATLVREVAESEILPYFRQLSKDDVREKSGPTDLVTIADEAAERVLTPRLMDLIPGSTVVGEEAVAADPILLKRMFGDDPVWIIDPVDGTINFANGNPTFAVIVAHVRGGETLAGWIHDPCGNRTAMAARGQGAWMDERRLRVASPVPVEAMVGALSTRFCDEATTERLTQGRSKIRESVCLACAAHEYLRLLEGKSHFSLYHRLMPWDHAAGVLLHAEAGGYSGLVNGGPYRPTLFEGSLLLAPDAESWERLHTALYGHTRP